MSGSREDGDGGLEPVKGGDGGGGPIVRSVTFKAARRANPSLGRALVAGSREIFDWCNNPLADADDAAKIMRQYGGHMVRRGSITRDEQIAWFEARFPGEATSMADIAPLEKVLSDGEGIASDGSIDREHRLVSRGTAGQIARRARDGVKAAEVVRGAAAVARAIGATVRGLPITADDATVTARRAACWACEHSIANPKSPDRKIQCGKCGCMLGPKTRLTTERCPIGVWEAV